MSSYASFFERFGNFTFSGGVFLWGSMAAARAVANLVRSVNQVPQQFASITSSNAVSG